MCKEEVIWRIDKKGHQVEEILYDDGRTEILVHMGHTIEEGRSFSEVIEWLIRIVVVSGIFVAGILIGKFM